MAKFNDKLIDAWEPRLKRAFLESVQNMRDAAQVDQIERMLERGDVEAALRAASIDPVSLRPLDRAFTGAFEAGGEATAAAIPPAIAADGIKEVFQFAVRNLAAEAWLSRHSGTLIQAITEDQRDAVRNFLTARLAEGANPRATALDLVGRVSSVTGKREGGIIGLTASQEGWARAYRTELLGNNPAQALSRALRDRRFDKAVLAAQESGQPLSSSLVEKMVTAYKNRALRYRAEAIARKETITALHAAQEQAVLQAAGKGTVNQGDVKYIWHTAHDKRVRDTHVTMDGQVRVGNQSFITGAGVHLRYPGDPNGPPGETINCFPAGTFVSARDIEKCFRRYYEGDLVEIETISGKRLSATPNHPILTSRGLVAISLLDEGDDLICCGPLQSSSVSDPDIDDVPSRIVEIFNSLSNSCEKVRSCGLPVDFHGDGTYRNVDVVLADRPLMFDVQASRLEPRDHLSLALANDPALSIGSLDELSKSSLFSSRSFVGASDLVNSLLSGHLGPLDPFGFGLISNKDAFGFENRRDLTASDVVSLGNREHRPSTEVKVFELGSKTERQIPSDSLSLSDPSNGFGVRSNAFGFEEAENGDLAYTDKVGDFLAGLSCDVKIDRLISKRVVKFSGHVFNLQTKAGHYTANGVVVGNCRCWREVKIDFLAGIR